MRILVVGAGAIGGYFGARLAEAGRDVTFLVRERRARELARRGLSVRSPRGDVHLARPTTVQAKDLSAPFDLILLSCKAYDLDGAIESLSPAVGAETAILPLLNGMRHLDTLDGRFGPDRVMGGLCFISATLDGEGRVLHLNDAHTLVYGPRGAWPASRTDRVSAALSGANFDARLSSNIALDMWEKWVLIAGTAGITCLMRASVGDIVAAGGGELASALLDECASIAAANDFPLPAAHLARAHRTVTAEKSPIKASMLRDIERGAPTEGDHILGELIHRSPQALPVPILRIAYTHVKAYEIARRSAASPTS